MKKLALAFLLTSSLLACATDSEPCSAGDTTCQAAGKNDSGGDSTQATAKATRIDNSVALHNRGDSKWMKATNVEKLEISHLAEVKMEYTLAAFDASHKPLEASTVEAEAHGHKTYTIMFRNADGVPTPAAYLRVDFTKTGLFQISGIEINYAVEGVGVTAEDAEG